MFPCLLMLAVLLLLLSWFVVCSSSVLLHAFLPSSCHFWFSWFWWPAKKRAKVTMTTEAPWASCLCTPCLPIPKGRTRGVWGGSVQWRSLPFYSSRHTCPPFPQHDALGAAVPAGRHGDSPRACSQVRGFSLELYEASVPIRPRIQVNRCPSRERGHCKGACGGGK